MQDRRQSQIRTHTVTLGAVLIVMGAYAFAPFDTMFTTELARQGIEPLWGVLMVTSGAGLAYGGTTRNRLLRWAGNAAGMFVTGWTVAVSWTGGIITPTLAACGVICLGCAATMMRDAIAGQNYRCMLKATGRWEV